MTEQTQNGLEPDLIDRIAAALPPEVRSDYYRELTHCRSLPENDEMLRILRIMQILALLMQQVPERIAAERERFEVTLRQGLDSLQETLASVIEYHRELERGLTKLPEHIAAAISPDAIAGRINESLRQQFASSTLPETARALEYVARNMKATVAEFQAHRTESQRVLPGIGCRRRSAIDELQSSISRAAVSARQATDALTAKIPKARRWVLCTLLGLALLIGMLLGVWLWGYSRPQPKAGQAVLSAPQHARETGPPSTRPSKGKP